MKHIKEFEGYYRKGQLVKISDDNDNYDEFRGKVLKIDHVAKNEREHPGYDNGMEGMGLYDLIDVETGEYVPFSLYDYELQPAKKY